MCWRLLNSAWCDLFSCWSLVSYLSRWAVSVKPCFLAGASVVQMCCSQGFSLRCTLPAWPPEHHCVMSLSCFSIQHMWRPFPRPPSLEDRLKRKEIIIRADITLRGFHSEYWGMEMRGLVPFWPLWSDSTQCLSFFLLYPESVWSQCSCSTPSSLAI